MASFWRPARQQSTEQSPVVYVVDDASPNISIVLADRNSRVNAVPPAPQGSGNIPVPPPRDSLPKFPNNAELVQDPKYTPLLAALLPTLQKYDCLTYTDATRRRSPWVRAFCDLYHPAGPWGNFRNSPDITSKRKYSFKSYQIPTLLRQLSASEASRTRSPVHQALHQALTEFYGKEAWYKEFMEGCREVAIVQVNRPMADRMEIPRANAAVFARTTTRVEPAAARNTTPTRKDSVTQGEAEASLKRKAQTTTEPPSQRRSSRRKSPPAASSVTTGCASVATAGSQVSGKQQQTRDVVESPARRRSSSQQPQRKISQSPDQRSPKSDESTPEGSRKAALEQKRADLEQILSRRSGLHREDRVSKQIQDQIDKIDCELLELVLR